MQAGSEDHVFFVLEVMTCTHLLCVIRSCIPHQQSLVLFCIGGARRPCHMCPVWRSGQHCGSHDGAQGPGRPPSLRLCRQWPPALQGETSRFNTLLESYLLQHTLDHGRGSVACMTVACCNIVLRRAHILPVTVSIMVQACSQGHSQSRAPQCCQCYCALW